MWPRDTTGDGPRTSRCNRTKTFELIKKRRERDWTFVFMGANQDSYEAGEAIAVDRGNARNWSATSADPPTDSTPRARA